MLDEHYADAIAQQLRARDLDVVTVSELRMKGTQDEPLLHFAAGERRALLTNNVGDFMPMHARWMVAGQSHFGLLFTDDASMPRSGPAIGRYVTALAAFMGARPDDRDAFDQVHWLS